MKHLRNIFFLSIIAFAIGMGLSGVMPVLDFVKNPEASIRSGFQSAWKPGFDMDYPEEFAKLLETYRHIESRYIEEIPIGQLVDGAIEGMLKATGDPYTSYMPPQAAIEFDNSINSLLEGIGAEVSMDDRGVRVVAPIKGSPADKAGIITGDYIVTVDGQELTGMTLTEAVSLIRGPKGSVVVLELNREGQHDLITLEITRDAIPIETIASEMINKEIGLIEISQFATKTDVDFFLAYEDLKKQGAKGLIIDVRSNPGGVLDTVLKIADAFVPKGEIILQVEDNTGQREVYRSKQKEGSLPTVIIIDKGSASASEILAAAIQEGGGMPVVGVQSYGKGSVQTTEHFYDGSEIKFTIAKWLTPEGNWINQVGVTPDYEVALPDVFKAPRIPMDKTLAFDENSEHVRTLQLLLDHLGYEPGRTDGYFGDKTRAAVEAYQKAKGLAVTGLAEPSLISQLTQEVVDSLDTADSQLLKAIEVLEGRIKK